MTNVGKLNADSSGNTKYRFKTKCRFTKYRFKTKCRFIWKYKIQNTDLKQNADSSGNNSPFTSGVKLRVRDILLCFWSNPSILKNDIHRSTEVLKTQAASQKVQSIENCKPLKTRSTPAGKRWFVFNPILKFEKSYLVGKFLCKTEILCCSSLAGG